MDKNLEIYVDQIMNEQEHRSGIFTSFFDVVVGAISDYRCGADVRGSFSTRRGVLWWTHTFPSMWTKFLILKSIKTVFSRGQSFLECFRLSLAESSKVARYNSNPNRVFHKPFDISQVQSVLTVSPTLHVRERIEVFGSCKERSTLWLLNDGITEARTSAQHGAWMKKK